MKKVVIMAIALSTSLGAQAAGKVIYNQDIFHVVQFSDEFTEEVTSCQINIGEFKKDKPRIAIYSKPTKTLESVGLSTYMGNYDGSGYQIKMDKNDLIKKGTSSAGGDAVYGNVGVSFLNELVDGNKLILRVHPDNRYADSATATYSLKGSSTAINKFKQCLSVK